MRPDTKLRCMDREHEGDPFLPPDRFGINSTLYGDTVHRYYRTRCKECEARRTREWRERYDKEHPGERNKGHQEWWHSSRGRAYQRRYNKKRREKARRARRELMAPIPTAVLEPIVRVLCRWGAADQEGMTTGVLGTAVVATRTGLSARRIYAILHREGKSCSLDTVEAICNAYDFISLDELRERTREWAQLTGDPWPDGYRIVKRRRKGKCAFCGGLFVLSAKQQPRDGRGLPVYCCISHANSGRIVDAQEELRSQAA